MSDSADAKHLRYDTSNVKHLRYDSADVKNYDTSNAKHLRYTAMLDIFQYVFSGILTISVIIFCAVQLIRLPADSSNIYVTIMVGLVLVWVPVKNVKSKITKKLAERMANNPPASGALSIPELLPTREVDDSAEIIPA